MAKDRKCGCSPCRCFLCCCACSCCILVAVIVAIIIILVNLKEPDVSVKGIVLRGMAVSPTSATMNLDVHIHLKNPNGWPLEGTIKQVNVDVWSLDKAASDEIGEELYLGQATLPTEVTVKTNSETDFVVRADVAISPSSSTADLLARLNRDCGVAAALKKTKMRAKIMNTIVKIRRREIDLRELDVEIDTLVPCDGA